MKRDVKILARMSLAILIASLCYIASIFCRNGSKSTIIAAATSKSCVAIIKLCGGTFVKLGQILGTRADIFNENFRRPFFELQERHRISSIDDGISKFPREIAEKLDNLYEISGAKLIGSGSVAQVYSIKKRNEKLNVAIKIVRSDSRSEMLTDILTIRKISRMLEKLNFVQKANLIPGVNRYIRILALQCNMFREARLHEAAFSALKDREDLCFPRLLSVLSPRILVMEIIEEAVRVSKNSPNSIAIVDRVLTIAFELLFDHSIIHFDLHPGNFLAKSNGKLVLLDWGLSASVQSEDRISVAHFFMALIANDAQSGARICLENSTEISSEANIEKFEKDISSLFSSHSRQSVSNFQLIEFSMSLIRIQSKHGIKSTDAFMLPIMALAVLEGSLKEFDPSSDFQRAALPAVIRAMERGTDI